VTQAGTPPAAIPRSTWPTRRPSDFIVKSFDFAVAAVQNMSPAAMSAEAELFGMKRAGWKWVIGVQEHTAWTLGQTVPYLRMNA